MITASLVDSTRYANEDSDAVKFKLEGLSTNQKPTVFSGRAVKNGSTFFEIDTGVTFVFDEGGKRWYPQPQAGGSGVPGAPGKDGEDGQSAYQIAVENGFVGTEEEWLASLQGEKGADGKNGKDGVDGTNGVNGKSAYQSAVENGYGGTEQEFGEGLNALLNDEDPTAIDFTAIGGKL